MERSQVDLRRAAGLNTARMQRTVQELCAGQVPGDTHPNLRVRPGYRGRTFKHVPMPVWRVSYTYGRRSLQVLVNGCTGAIAGERPTAGSR